MRKYLKCSLVIAGLLLASNTYAGGSIDLTSGATDVANEIKKLFPIVAGALFIVVCLMNLGHFTKEGGDWKKGFTNIVLYVVVVSIIAGLYSFVSSQTL